MVKAVEKATEKSLTRREKEEETEAGVIAADLALHLIHPQTTAAASER